jgi:hypothetical protein
MTITIRIRITIKIEIEIEITISIAIVSVRANTSLPIHQNIDFASIVTNKNDLDPEK